jgi:hypothetical protein
MLDKSLFICYSTPNYSKLTNMFLNSLYDIHVNDNNINHMFDDSVSKMFTETGFQTDLWYYSIINKLQHLINVLKNHDSLNNIKYFISTDCDIIYIKNNINEWNNLENYMQNENKDIYFMREDMSSDINGGFFIIKNNDNITNIINFFIKVLQTMVITEKVNMPLADQTIINKYKEIINYGFIPNDYVIWATNIHNINKSLFHHAVCCRDVDDKIKQINQIKSNFK